MTKHTLIDTFTYDVALSFAGEDREYPLREAATAHRDVEARNTTGAVVLMP